MSDDQETYVLDGIRAMRDVQQRSDEDVALELAQLRREKARLEAALDRDSSREGSEE